MNVPCGNRTHNYSLGAQVIGVNSCQGQFTYVKESIDFTDFPVIRVKIRKQKIIQVKRLRWQNDDTVTLRVQPFRSLEFISMATIRSHQSSNDNTISY